MTVYDSNSFSLVPAGVSVIYVSVEEARSDSQRTVCGASPLRAAAQVLHSMADRVDEIRRSIERARDGARY